MSTPADRGLFRARGAVMAALFLALPVTAALDLAPWRYRRIISQASGAGTASVKLDRWVYLHARHSLADIRVVRNGEQVPYVLETSASAVEDREWKASSFDQAVVPGVGVELTLDLGGHPRHNRVRIATPKENFRQQVRIETSDDARQWAIARREGYIFDFTHDGRKITDLAVDYPVSTRRYVRVTVLGWDDTRAVAGAWINYRSERRAERDVLATLEPRVAEDVKAGATLLTLDAGAGGLPYDRVRIETAAPRFHRAAEVESSGDGKNWNYLGSGVFSRIGPDESLFIDVPLRYERYLRLRVFHHDDRPIPVAKVYLEALERRVRFESNAAREAWLYYGNPEAKAPVYDLPVVLARQVPAAGTTAALGPEQPSPIYRPAPAPQKPWSERHPVLLYVTLIVAVLGLGSASVLMLRKMNSA